MAASAGKTISNMGTGAATGASVGGPWGAVIGGVAGGVASLFEDDPAEQRRAAMRDYQGAINAAQDEYVTEQNKVLSGYQDLYTPEGVKSAKESYTGALTSSDPTKYAINAGDYQSTYKDPLSSWKDYLDPSIEFQQEAARKNIEESAAGRGGLYSGAATREISTEIADIARVKGYESAYDRARQAGLDVNAITGENFARGMTAGNYNVGLEQTGIQNKGTAYGVERDLMDTVSAGQSDINKTRMATQTSMANTNLGYNIGETGGPSTWDQIIGGVGQAQQSGMFNKDFWNFGGK